MTTVRPPERGRWRCRLAVVVLAATGGACTPTDDVPPLDAADGANATVTRVVDGDTIVADISGIDERVRLVGIDTPESVDPRRPVECFGVEAKDRLGSLLPDGTPIRLERDEEARDDYDRLLAYVVRTDRDLFVNLDLVATGHATTLEIEPNLAHAPALRAAEADARAARRGLWGACPDPNG